MKKNILLTLIFVTIAKNVISVPIYVRNTENGGPNGYYTANKVEYDIIIPVPLLKPMYWPNITFTYIECKDPGQEPCPTTILQNNNNYDVNDINQVNQLVSLADNSYSNSGSSSNTIIVSGENFKRVYTVTWNTDTNGKKSVEVDRTNVEL